MGNAQVRHRNGKKSFSKSRTKSMPQLDSSSSENDSQFMESPGDRPPKSILRISRGTRGSTPSLTSTLKSVAFRELDEDGNPHNLFPDISTPHLIHIPRVQYVRNESYETRSVVDSSQRSSTMDSSEFYLPPKVQSTREGITGDSNSVISGMSGISLPRYPLPTSLPEYRQELRHRLQYKKLPAPKPQRTVSLLRPDFGDRSADSGMIPLHSTNPSTVWQRSETSSLVMDVRQLREETILAPKRVPFKAFALPERGIADGDSFSEESENVRPFNKFYRNADLKDLSIRTGEIKFSPEKCSNISDFPSNRRRNPQQIKESSTRRRNEYSYDVNERRMVQGVLHKPSELYSNFDKNEGVELSNAEGESVICRFKSRPRMSYVKTPSLPSRQSSVK